MIEDNVNKYIQKNLSSVLVFVKVSQDGLEKLVDAKLPGRKITDISKNKDLDAFIHSLYKKSISHCSAPRSDPTHIETRSSALRSSIDIWRHAKYYFPDISIFSVMNSIYRLTTVVRLYGQYCSVVRRRVFYAFADGFLAHTTYPDEYGMTLPQWEKVGSGIK